MELRDLGPLPEHEQTDLFSMALIPAEELEKAQGITGPQGLKVEPSEQPDEDAADRYLAIMLEDPEQ
jgi:hypothetical protein